MQPDPSAPETTAQDCGHDLERIERQTAELARLRERLDVAQTAYLAQAEELTTTRVSLSLGDQERLWNRNAYEQTKAERDRLADTVRRYEPVIVTENAPAGLAAGVLADHQCVLDMATMKCVRNDAVHFCLVGAASPAGTETGDADG